MGTVYFLQSSKALMRKFTFIVLFTICISHFACCKPNSGSGTLDTFSGEEMSGSLSEEEFSAENGLSGQSGTDINSDFEVTTVIDSREKAPTATFQYFPFITATGPRRQKRENIPIIEN